jgi:hypothetical protein
MKRIAVELPAGLSPMEPEVFECVRYDITLYGVLFIDLAPDSPDQATRVLFGVGTWKRVRPLP